LDIDCPTWQSYTYMSGPTIPFNQKKRKISVRDSSLHGEAIDRWFSVEQLEARLNNGECSK